MRVPHDKLPTVFRHMVLGILAKEKAVGSQSFAKAMNIARGQLTKYGYMLRGSDKGPLADMRLSSSGTKKDAEHRKDSKNSVKMSRFRAYYEQYVADYEAASTKMDEQEKDRRDG